MVLKRERASKVIKELLEEIRERNDYKKKYKIYKKVIGNNNKGNNHD